MFAQSGADGLVQAAAAELAQGRIALAGSLLESALQSDPRHPMALTLKAEAMLHGKDTASALTLTGAVLDREPHFAPAWHRRAAALWLDGRQPEAVDAARRAMDIQPPNPAFRLRFAQFSAWTGKGADALHALGPLLAGERHDPLHYAMAIGALGELAIAEGRFTDACTSLDRALAVQPNLRVTRTMRGMNLLRLGRFREGWADYAARESEPGLGPGPGTTSPRRGQPLAGKTVLVSDDQGHGDAIQFFRYLPLLRNRGATRVVWRTFPPLVRLLVGAAPYATVLTVLPAAARFDFHCHSASLPRWFGTDLDSIPAPVPLWPASIRPKRRRPDVGLIWSGDPLHTRDHVRSIPADLFLALADVPGMCFHSLQHQVRPADLPALRSRPAIGRAAETAADFAVTAAAIARLDLVITVDTAVAHLAGAMGKPVWIVLHAVPDWRWLIDRPDSPWYPSARLFRVSPAEWLGGDGWQPVLGRVAEALRAWGSDQNHTPQRPAGE